MSVSENLKKAVEEKNIDDIRGCLWSCIAVDMNMTGRFKESLGYALSNGINEYELFQDDDGTPFKTEASKDNFSELGGLLRVNFSKKKLDALRKMGLSLYPPKMESEGPKKIRGQEKDHHHGLGNGEKIEKNICRKVREKVVSSVQSVVRHLEQPEVHSLRRNLVRKSEASLVEALPEPVSGRQSVICSSAKHECVVRAGEDLNKDAQAEYEKQQELSQLKS